MVKTRASGDGSQFGDKGKDEEMFLMSANEEQENEGVETMVGTRSRRKTGDPQGQPRSLSMSNDINRCNSVADSLASTSGFSAVSSKHESDDSFRPGQQEKPTQARMAYRRRLDQIRSEPDESSNNGLEIIENCTQPNVRRSTRQKRPIYPNMNEQWIETSPYYDHDDYYNKGERSRPPQNPNGRELRSRRTIVKLQKDSPENGRRCLNMDLKQSKGRPGYNELRRLGLESVPSDNDEDEDDMYSRIKTSRRKLSHETGALGDNEDTDLQESDNGEDNADNEDEEDEEPIPRILPRLRRRQQMEISASATGTTVSEPSVTDSEDREETGPSKYYLRPKRQVVQTVSMNETLASGRSRGASPPRRISHHRFHSRSPVHRRSRKRKHVTLNSSNSDTSSSSDESRFERRKSKNMVKARSKCLPMNLNEDELRKGVIRDRQKIGGSLADIDPMAIDTSIHFESIGGLEQHVKSLKEMVLFPLMYPEVFEKYKIQPPRGVLFHGPPGTGKTLVARALANECGTDDKKVAFFMRKGADCMSKWVGESERQLRLLFDQAYAMRPSIIFFDEIDGIAPVRSTRQDQIHSSIVSTLLALMDGLDNRGEVIIIGATNRIEAIDPALRRPGRFDREFYFSLPSFEAREEILKIHTKEWQPSLTPDVLQLLAAQTVGYCGADLKALCAESALVALRRRYPQIYSSRHKLVLNTSDITIELRDFSAATKQIVPASQRSVGTPSRPLSDIVRPLLSRPLKKASDMINSLFPAGKHRDKSSKKGASSDLISDEEDVQEHLAKGSEENGYKYSCQSLRWLGNFRPRFLLHGLKDQGQSSHLGPAILHSYEHITNLKLDLATLYSVTTRTPEEALSNIFSEARKRLPAIVYMPHINLWWPMLSDTLRVTLTTLIDDIEPTAPLLLLATSDCLFNDIQEDLQEVFSDCRSTPQVMEMTDPSRKEREAFFAPLFKSYVFKLPQDSTSRVLEELPIAPPPEPRKLTEKEVRKLRRKEETSLRELRLFLRDIHSKIMRDRRFAIFLKPVDLSEVPDYLEVIGKPMDLETMMAKIDLHAYDCAKQFLDDIHLICYNALEYNPDRDPTDKLIRHRACALKDTADALIAAEMDSDFEEMCQGISKSREDRGDSPAKSAPTNYYVRRGVPGLSAPSASACGATSSNHKEEDIDLGAETEIESCMSPENTTHGSESGNSTLTSSINESKDGISGTPVVRKRGRRPKNRTNKRMRPEVEEVKSAINGNLVNGEHSDHSSKGNGSESNPKESPIQPEAVADAVPPLPVAAAASAPDAKHESPNKEVVTSDVTSDTANSSLKEVTIDKAKVVRLMERVLDITEDYTVEHLEEFYSSLFLAIKKRTNDWDRTTLVKDLTLEVDKFERHSKIR